MLEMKLNMIIDENLHVLKALDRSFVHPLVRKTLVLLFDLKVLIHELYLIPLNFLSCSTTQENSSMKIIC